MRPPLASADAPSMADSLPSINFGFEDLRNRMAQFTAKFDAVIERGRKQVLEERNQFHINLAELQGTINRRGRGSYPKQKRLTRYYLFHRGRTHAPTRH
jgi:kinetochore protein Spc25